MCNDPYVNHAVEEYFLKYIEEDCFILWKNRPCILIGKNQNTLSEINLQYVDKFNIPVVRRLSGGGAVFNDLGNLNFTFISTKNSKFADFKSFTYPVIKALKSLGVNAELSGRNDLIIDGKKFSGNAQYRYKNKILHHGTILFDSNLGNLTGALKVSDIKFKDKGIKSIANRVTNIRKYLKDDMTVEEFKDFLINDVMKQFGAKEQYIITKEDKDIIDKISKEKYSTWEWNYGNSPKSNFFNEEKLKCGIVQVTLSIADGSINSIKINGDFFGREDIGGLENLIVGVKYRKEDILEKINAVDISRFITNISLEEFINILFPCEL